MPKPPSNGVRRRRDPSEDATTTSATDKVADAVKAVEDKASQTLLILWDELEDWRRDNAFILGGYRRTSNSYAASLASLLHLHNESVNIWTHLVGAVGFTATGAYFLQAVVRPRVAEAYGGDVLAFACFFAGAFLCLGMSATFHTLSNHSPAVAKWGNKLDYTGIVFLIVGSYVPALYYGFRCHPALLELYLSMICILGLGCLAVSWVDHFRSPAWRPYRALMFVGLGLSGVVPVMHAIGEDGFAALDQRMGLRWVLLQGGMYIFGAFIYAARWPERSFPGKFDIWCSSHQIFHVFVLLAAASHLYGMIKAFDFRHSPMGSAQC